MKFLRWLWIDEEHEIPYFTVKFFMRLGFSLMISALVFLVLSLPLKAVGVLAFPLDSVMNLAMFSAYLSIAGLILFVASAITFFHISKKNQCLQ